MKAKYQISNQERTVNDKFFYSYCKLRELGNFLFVLALFTLKLVAHGNTVKREVLKKSIKSKNHEVILVSF